MGRKEWSSDEPRIVMSSSFQKGRIIKHFSERESDLINEVKRKGLKISEEKVMFIIRDPDHPEGIVWLETGEAEKSGFAHIKEQHANDFKNKFGYEPDQIPNFIKHVIIYGRLIHTRDVIRQGHLTYDKTYEINNQRLLISFGSNGYIANSFPIGDKRCIK